MFLNETLLVLTYTANIMSRLPEQEKLSSLDDPSDFSNLTTTTLSPEEEENKFEFEDRKSAFNDFKIRHNCFKQNRNYTFLIQ